MTDSVKQRMAALNNVGIEREVRPLFDQLKVLTGSATHDFADLATGTQESVDITVTGARVGDFALASVGVDTVDGVITAAVVADDTVAVTLVNEKGSNINLASTTVRVIVFPQAFGLSA